jgi:hypothetical protein
MQKRGVACRLRDFLERLVSRIIVTLRQFAIIFLTYGNQR